MMLHLRSKSSQSDLSRLQAEPRTKGERIKRAELILLPVFPKQKDEFFPPKRGSA
jgi:hypothetical protein